MSSVPNFQVIFRHHHIGRFVLLFLAKNPLVHELAQEFDRAPTRRRERVVIPFEMGDGKYAHLAFQIEIGSVCGRDEGSLDDVDLRLCVKCGCG